MPAEGVIRRRGVNGHFDGQSSFSTQAAVLERLGVDGRDLRFGEGLGAVHDPVGV
jgi:hypothetical protein